jgi:cytochrome P450
MLLSQKIQFFTMDVISSVGLGRSFEMLAADADKYGYLRSAEEGLFATNIVAPLGLNWLPDVPLLGRFMLPSPNDKRGFGKMIATAYAFVDGRVADPTDARSDMLASFIRNGLAGDELRTEALFQVLAGSDTTSGALRGILLYLFASPRVYAKLQAEIDDAVNTGLAPPPPSIISVAQALKLHFLQAVIREAMRVWPPVTDLFPRDGNSHPFIPLTPTLSPS